MFLEEFHEWGERHDHNSPSLGDGGAESGSQDDCRMSMSPSPPYLGPNISLGPDFEQLRIGSTSPDPVVVPPQIRHRSPLRSPIPDLDKRGSLQNEPARPERPEPPFLDQLEVRLILKKSIFLPWPTPPST
jgi:hypothetical protein